MGLGKTVIGIAAAEKLIEEGKVGTCLIVCPPSLKYQWAQRLAEFTDMPSHAMKLRDETIVIPDDTVLTVIDGIRKTRLEQYDRSGSCSYIIIGYENIIYDYPEVARIKPDMVILDEATAIKSFKALRSKRIKKALKSRYRLALTGTPIENKPDEVFSIMQWVDEKILGRYDLFDKAYITRNKYGWPVSYKNLPVLKARLAPAISRKSRLDPDVAPFLPDVEETEWHVPVNDETLGLYRKIARDMLNELNELGPRADLSIHDYYSGSWDESQVSGKLMSQYTALSMLLDHPDLVIFSGQLYKNTDKNGSEYAYRLWQSGALDSVLTAPKLDFLLDKMDSILSFDDSKVLIYSQWVHMLTILDQALPCDCVKFHGSMSAQEKAEAIARFTNNPEIRVLLSSDAGAYGLDMKMANYLINYDVPWSAGKWDQRSYRHVRAASEFEKVYLVHMSMAGTIEDRKLRILKRKKAIASAVLDGHGHDESGSVIMEGDSLRDTLEAILGTPKGP
jgi:SNF2 family DNA or RNA helicase